MELNPPLKPLQAQESPRSSTLKSFFVYFIFYAIGATIFTNILGFVLLLVGGYIFALFSLLQISQYSIPYESLVGLLPMASLVLSFFVYLVVSKFVKRVVGFNTRIFLVSLILAYLVFVVYSAAICMIDLFFGCQLNEVLSPSALIRRLVILLPMIVSYAYLVRSEGHSRKVKFVSLVLIVLLLIVLSGFFYLPGILRSIDDRGQTPLLLRENVQDVKTTQVLVPEVEMYINIPVDYLGDQPGWHKSTKTDEVYANSPFDFVYGARFEEAGSGAIGIKVLHIEKESEFPDLLEYFNYCGKDYYGPFVSRNIDESEICSSLEDVVHLANGVSYCETYNLRNAAIAEANQNMDFSKLGFLERQMIKRSAGVIEDRERVYIAKLPNLDEFCFKMTFYHEPADTREEGIQALSKMILESIQVN